MRSQGFKSPHLHPHLVTRVSNADAPIDSVILSGHSQGAVLAFATILQLRGHPESI